MMREVFPVKRICSRWAASHVHRVRPCLSAWLRFSCFSEHNLSRCTLRDKLPANDAYITVIGLSFSRSRRHDVGTLVDGSEISFKPAVKMACRHNGVVSKT